MDRALWPLLYAWPIAVAFVFPTGRLLSPRWRWIAALAALDWALFIALGFSIRRRSTATMRPCPTR